MAVNIVTRQTGSYAKNSTLTNTELDTNFINLKDAVDNVNVNIENTKSSIRPSLLLDFANSKRLDKRITFTRASKATRYNSDGLLEVVDSGKPRFDHDPATKESLGLLIEEQRQNLLVYTDNFAYATGVYAPMVLSQNVATAPDGSLTACKASTSNGGSFYKESYGITGTETYTLSIYINTKSTCTLASFSGYFTGNANQSFSVGIVPSAGTADIAGKNGSASNIIVNPPVNVGGGWYRYSMTATGTNSANNKIIWQVYSNVATTNDIIFWGAQVEEGAFATSYIPSKDTFTSRASPATYIGSDGLIKSAAINTARYNYNPVNLKAAPKLLLEPASTNLLTYSEQFDNAVWENAGGNLGIAVTPNNIVSPDGTLNADKITNDGGAISLFFYNVLITASSTSEYTASVFVKAGTATKFVFNCYYAGNTEDNVLFDLTTGTIVVNDNTTAKPFIIAMGNGWYRIGSVLTRDATGTRTSILFRGWGISSGSRGNGVIGEYYYVWGAQLESGTTATSYIPAATGQGTRNADIGASAQYTRVADSAVMTGTNFSSWYRQDEGTLSVTAKIPVTFNTGKFGQLVLLGIPYNYNTRFCLFVNPANTFGLYHENYGVLQTEAYKTYSTSSTITQAAGYKVNDIAYSNGNDIIFTDTSATIPTFTILTIGQGVYADIAGVRTISKIAYYPKRLSNTELQSLTGG